MFWATMVTLGSACRVHTFGSRIVAVEVVCADVRLARRRRGRSVVAIVRWGAAFF